MKMAKTRVVLFSGGSASNLLAFQLERWGFLVTNVLTVFDNGGSTGELRRVAAVPAMGDIRNRLVALASESSEAHRMLKRLFDLRFSERKAQQQLSRELDSVLNLSDPLTSGLPELERNSIRDALRCAIATLPRNFPLRKHSLGNLLLFGRALENNDFLEAIDWAGGLLGVSSQVLPVTLESAHLGARLETRQWVVGQADLTAEGDYHLPSPIQRLCLLQREDSYALEAKPCACSSVIDAIRQADVLAIGFGSFFTSILPNFLVHGVGAEFARLDKPKVFLCNPTTDRESEPLTVQSMVDTLSVYITRDSEPAKATEPIVTHILHFIPDPKTCVPRGDLTEFLRRGGHYVANERAKDFEAIAVTACDVMRSLFGSSTTRAIETRAERPSRRVPVVILFDLDATLFDYTTLRAQATCAALDGIVDDPERVSEELAETLRPPLTDLLFGLGLPDLRVKWDSPEVFGVARILMDSSLRPDLEATAEAARTLSGSEGAVNFRGRLQLVRNLKGMKNTQSLLDALRDIVARSDDSSFAAQRRVFVGYVEKNAALASGAKEIISRLRELNADIHVVSEGDSDIQNFKFNSLGLQDLVHSCVVSDVTCGVGLVLPELYELFRNQEEIPDVVGQLYDLLETYSMKSVPFFVKLLHALVDQERKSLRDRIQSSRFLTVQEWEESIPPSVVMVGDRYEKDIEPFLKAGNSGVRAFRIVRGRYAKEFPMHELIAEERPLPHGEFGDLRHLFDPLAGLIKELREPIERPNPILPEPELIEEVVRTCPGLSDRATNTLLALKSEVLRQREAR